MADGERAVVEQVVLGGEPGDGARTFIVAPTATIHFGKSAKVQVLIS